MLRITTLLLCVFALFTSCVEENIQTLRPQVDGFSDPNSKSFSPEELATLNETLNETARVAARNIAVPLHIQQTGVGSFISTNDADQARALLGRVLFYDQRLSATGETTCASCHLPDKAFSDVIALSDGISGQKTKRNSIALGSVPSFTPSVSGYGSTGDERRGAVSGTVRFFWDERAATVKEQSVQTIEDPAEMGQHLESLSDALSQDKMYQILTMKAFGTTNLTPDRLTLALERFVGTMSAMNTRFDELRDDELLGEEMAGRYSARELKGNRIFRLKCGGCHGEALTQPTVSTANNGLDFHYEDQGIGARRGEAFNGVFKVPFLRNVALTAPYMHDGRFATLEEVIDHYSEGIKRHENLHPLLRGGPMHFSDEEKAALVAFLEMTTDHDIANDPLLSDPFKH